MTKVPLYREAIINSWRLAWNHKLMWGFGLFAAFLGQMGILELVTKIGLTGTSYAYFPTWIVLPDLYNLSTSLGSLSLPLEGWLWVIWLGLVLFGFAVLLTFASVSSQGAIIHSTAQAVKKPKKLPDVDSAWRSGTSHFWRLFVLNLIKKVVISLLAISLAYATVNVIISASGIDYALFVSIFVLSAIVGMVLSFLVIYAAGYVVVEEYSIGKAIRSAWRLFTNHWLVSIEVAIVILFLNIVLSLAILVSFFILFFPTLLLWWIAVYFVSSALYYVAIVIGMILFTIFIIFVGSVFTVFTTSVWTYLFMKMHKPGVTSRVLHWFGFRS